VAICIQWVASIHHTFPLRAQALQFSETFPAVVPSPRQALTPPRRPALDASRQSPREQLTAPEATQRINPSATWSSGGRLSRQRPEGFAPVLSGFVELKRIQLHPLPVGPVSSFDLGQRLPRTPGNRPADGSFPRAFRLFTDHPGAITTAETAARLDYPPRQHRQPQLAARLAKPISGRQPRQHQPIPPPHRPAFWLRLRIWGSTLHRPSWRVNSGVSQWHGQ